MEIKGLAVADFELVLVSEGTDYKIINGSKRWEKWGGEVKNRPGSRLIR